MESYPNIFDYATKEFTQDAIICWFLECLNSTEKEIKEIGKEFLRNFVFDNKIQIDEAELIECSRQYHKMDVYARVFINKKYIFPIIFENKTNTFLHNNQLERYCDMVYGWFWNKPDEALEIQKKDIVSHENIDVKSYEAEIGKTQYIMFKSSEIFSWEQDEFNIRCSSFCNNNYYNEEENSKKYINSERAKQIEEKTEFHIRRLSDMYKFLEAILDKTKKISLLEDYQNYIENKLELENFDKNWDEWKNNKEGYEKALDSHIGQWKFFEACGAEIINCQSNSGIWSSYTISPLSSENEENPDTIHYCFRYGWRKGKKAVYFQQYRWEKGVTNNDSKQRKQKEYDGLSEKLKGRNLLSNYNIISDFNNGKKGVDGKEIFRIVFNESNNTPENVSKFIREFVGEFENILSNVRNEIYNH